MSDNAKVVLIGAGRMADEYAKVLKEMDVCFDIVANRKENADKMRLNYNVDVYEGGIDRFIESNQICKYDHIINAVNAENLGHTTASVLSAGGRKILIEKPGFYSAKEAELIKNNKKNSEVFVAYNRRFYESTNCGLKIVKEDGGVKSLSFEFTEWRHIFDSMKNRDKDLKFLFYNNSMHVVDMAFFLADSFPKELSSFVGGKNVIDWHKVGSIFSGAGVLENGALFSYASNWNSPGRWRIEINTDKHRLIYSPLERLQLMDIGSVKVYDFDADYSLDDKFKPGLYKEVECFLGDNKDGKLCTLEEQLRYASICNQISGEMDGEIF